MTNARTRNRLILILIALVFLVPLALAFLFNATGWRPAKTSNRGTLVQPPRDVDGVAVTLSDGSALVWRDPQWQWTLLALPGAQCGAKCRERLDEMLRMRITLGRSGERVRIVYIGPALPPDMLAQRAPLLAGSAAGGALDAYRPQAADDLALALVDPQGLLMMTYPAGYPAIGVRCDLKQVFHESTEGCH